MMELLRPDDLLPGRIDGYDGLEYLASRNRSRTWSILDDDIMDGGESRRRLDAVRPFLPGHAEKLEGYLSVAADVQPEGLVPKAVEMSAHLGTILLTPHLYLPSLDFVSLGVDQHDANAFVHHVSIDYLRERPALHWLVSETVIDEEETNPSVRRTKEKVAGLTLWLCEVQNYLRWVNEHIEDTRPSLDEWDGTLPDIPPRPGLA